jgi:hypothetical protein
MYVTAYTILTIPQRTRFYPEDGASLFLQNINIHLQNGKTHKCSILIRCTVDKICTEYFNGLTKRNKKGIKIEE